MADIGEVALERIRMPGTSVWLDDVRPMPEGFDVAARSFDEAVRLLSTGSVVEISFDHDLGEGPTGYDVACIIERAAMEGVLGRIKWAIHSANPVGRKNIQAAMEKADQYWDAGRDRGLATASALNEDLWKMAKELPSDFQPYGLRSRDEPEWSPDCSCGCRHFQELSGLAGMDWGVCSNPKSPRAGMLTFEHMGCPNYEDELFDDTSNLANIARWAEAARSRKG